MARWLPVWIVPLFLLLSSPFDAAAAIFATSDIGGYRVDETTGDATVISTLASGIPGSVTASAYGMSGLVVADDLGSLATISIHDSSGFALLPVTPVGWLAGTPGRLTALAYGPVVPIPVPPLPGVPVPEPVLYGVFDDGSGGYLVVVAIATGTVTPVAPFPVAPLAPGAEVTDLAYSPASGMLASTGKGLVPSAILTLSLVTGVATASTPVTDGASSLIDVAGIEFEPVSGTLFAIAGDDEGASPSIFTAGDWMAIVAPGLPGAGTATATGVNTGIALPSSLTRTIGLVGTDVPGAIQLEINPLHPGPPIFFPLNALVPSLPFAPLDIDWGSVGGSPELAHAVDALGGVGAGQSIHVIDDVTNAVLSTAALVHGPGSWIPLVAPGGVVDAIEVGAGGVLYGIYNFTPSLVPGFPVGSIVVTVDPVTGSVLPVLAAPPGPAPAIGTGMMSFFLPIRDLQLDPATGFMFGIVGTATGDALILIDQFLGDLAGAPAPPPPAAIIAAPSPPFSPGGGAVIGLDGLQVGSDGALYATTVLGPTVGGLPTADSYVLDISVPGFAPILAASPGVSFGAVTLGSPSLVPEDSDLDGLSDPFEEQISLTDPSNADTDGDGLADGDEVNVHLTDPNLGDTDGDSLTDGEEINVHSTNPLLRDTDGDGFDDDVELAAGTDPNDPNDFPVTPVPALPLLGQLALVIALLGTGAALRRRACAGVAPPRRAEERRGASADSRRARPRHQQPDPPITRSASMK